MKTAAGAAMLFAVLTMAGSGQTAAPAADRSFEQFWTDAQKEKRADKSAAAQKRIDWWLDARFGMFIHWNMVSLMGSEISFSRESYDGGLGSSTNLNPRAALTKGSEYEGWLDGMMPSIPKEVYDNLYKSFYPGMFDADKLVAQAKQAGMKYIVQVAKHCDGFCLWHSRVDEYSIANTPFKRDVCGELADAEQ